ncbi:TetR/AcrR family transcriptional regulator [Clostridium luticellarii]|uniref:TetR family regulatory protein n=1 Tax=Clostridium luticellarii TaxID=1691940 RepID=A0A2T0BJZ4_9CLOT|nr:TetR/AcrR family transcriptional regulator [Clostridium luticellarii]MCI1946265.1 TetR/AcrR family transcriptional regulator [Clostridium luticellarii]MCI1969446.1 TetR/AcrR family transcriptional regulator [Clostridium luticellarii]MCI1996610.1 TetR/AcrR family transcriptional regulator [Clostridium luticellarii]MCI2039614.1 TetR/AcrR family transcriptional regulator [Clostridium luticellarii]PRR84215.1 tetR family regulatory protein [Clostridium luticellarii]
MGRAYTEEEREKLRIRIKQLGKEMFEEEGFKNFRIQKLTKEAGISLGGFYTFFQNKESLYKEILNDEKNRIRAKIIDWVKECHIGPRDFFIEIADKFQEKARGNKLYEARESYNLVDEVLLDTEDTNKRENLAFIQKLREIWEERGIYLNGSNEEIYGVLALFGIIAMKWYVMDESVFKKLYGEVCDNLIEKIARTADS